jgi:hypothetical protein
MAVPRPHSARHVQDGVGVLHRLVQCADRQCRGQEDKIHLAMARRFLDLFHYRQSTIGTSADHQPTTLPGDVFLDRERSMPVRAAKTSSKRPFCVCGSFLRLRIFPWSMIRSWLQVTPSTRIEPNEYSESHAAPPDESDLGDPASLGPQTYRHATTLPPILLVSDNAD